MRMTTLKPKHKPSGNFISITSLTLAIFPKSGQLSTVCFALLLPETTKVKGLGSYTESSCH